MRFARWTFYGAAAWGFVSLPPMYFLERAIVPPVVHPEFFYGFVGVALAFQIVFLTMGRDPGRYRPLIPAALVEKISFGAAVWLLFAQGRVAAPVVVFGTIDLAWAVLFAAVWLRTAPYGAAEATGGIPPA